MENKSPPPVSDDPASGDVVWHHATVTRERREAMNGHRGAILWFTGLSGAGKSTLAHAVEEHLHRMGCRTFVLDGDNVRHGLCADLGFSAFISPFREDRNKVRAMVQPGEFIEIYCQCPINICEQRDVKGLYKKARAGEIGQFTGISSAYEPPDTPELIVKTSEMDLNDCVQKVLQVFLKDGSS